MVVMSKNNLIIGYMFPKSFEIDINKESVYWKCMVKIPMVDYDEYIKEIKNIFKNKKEIKNEILNEIINECVYILYQTITIKYRNNEKKKKDK
jgi:5'-3' exonuclease